MELNNRLVALRRLKLEGSLSRAAASPGLYPGYDVWERGLAEGMHASSCHWLSSASLLYPRVLW